MSKYLTITQVAQKLQCTERTVYRYLRDKSLSAIKVGSRTLIPVENVQALFNAAPEWKPKGAPRPVTDFDA